MWAATGGRLDGGGEVGGERKEGRRDRGVGGGGGKKGRLTCGSLHG
jgi:hypothetical protein